MEMHLSLEQGGSCRSLEGYGWLSCAVAWRSFMVNVQWGKGVQSPYKGLSGDWVMI